MKTQTKVKSALIEMLETMPVEDITATELCRRANVNRATFYYHYNCVQDVLAEIEKQIEKEFVEWVSQATVTNDGQPAKSFYVTFRVCGAQRGRVQNAVKFQAPKRFFGARSGSRQNEGRIGYDKALPELPRRQNRLLLHIRIQRIFGTAHLLAEQRHAREH